MILIDGKKAKAKKESMWERLADKKSVTRKEYYTLLGWVKLFIFGGIAVGLAIFVAIAILGGLPRVVSTILSADYLIYSLAFLSVFCSFLLAFIKWNYYLKKLGVKVPLGKNIVVYLSMFSMDLTPGKIGRVIVAYTLDRVTNIKFVSLLPIVTTDIFTDFLGFAAFALISSVFFGQYILYVLIIDALLTLPFLFIVHHWFYRKLKGLIKRNNIFSRFTIYGDEYFAAQSALSTKKVYTLSMLVAIPEAFLLCLAFTLTLMAIGVAAPVGKTTFFYSVAQLVGMVSPGSLGVTDGALVAFANTVFHFSGSVSSAATIMTRFATLWFGIVMGSVFLLYSLRYWNRRTGRKHSIKAQGI